MKHKICSSCEEEKPVSEFNTHKSRGLQNECIECRSLYNRRHYLSNRYKYLTKAKENRRKLRSATKTYLKEYLETHHCVSCPESDPVVLDFDHIDRSTKSFNIASAVGNKPLKEIIREIGKCQILCANCHRRKTAKELGWRTYCDGIL